jgi:hypothetical protein
MYDWLTALFIEVAAAPTEVKEILYISIMKPT